ncbi:hypothetical protein ACA910_001465 [Epithemia clementina (nom. ined.)]
MDFLKFLDKLCTIILQDAAAIIGILESDHDDPRSAQKLTSSLFRLPVFSSIEFCNYVSEMMVVLENHEIGSSNDPNFRAVDRCLPGVNQRFSEIASQLQTMSRAIETLHSSQADYMHGEFDNIKNDLKFHMDSKQRNLVSAMASFFKDGVAKMSDVVVGTSNSLGSQALITTNENDLYDNSQSTITFSKEGMLERGSASTSLFTDDKDRSMQLDQTFPKNNAANPCTDDELLQKVSGAYMSISRLGHQKNINLRDLYSEFFGIGNLEGRPIDGGFADLEKRFCNRWRKNKYSQKEDLLFSRVAKLCRGVSKKAGVEEGCWNDAVVSICEEWQPLMAHGIGGALSRLQSANEIDKRETRSRCCPSNSS